MKGINILNYPNLTFIEEKIKKNKKLFKISRWPIVDVTRKSVKETTATIIKIFDVQKGKK